MTTTYPNCKQIKPTGHYHFSIRSGTGYGAGGLCLSIPPEGCPPRCAPAPPSPGVVVSPTQMLAGTGPTTVSLDVATIGAILQPATTYNFTVLAATPTCFITLRPDLPFTTPGATG